MLTSLFEKFIEYTNVWMWIYVLSNLFAGGMNVSHFKNVIKNSSIPILCYAFSNVFIFILSTLSRDFFVANLEDSKTCMFASSIGTWVTIKHAMSLSPFLLFVPCYFSPKCAVFIRWVFETIFCYNFIHKFFDDWVFERVLGHRIFEIIFDKIFARAFYKDSGYKNATNICTACIGLVSFFTAATVLGEFLCVLGGHLGFLSVLLSDAASLALWLTIVRFRFVCPAKFPLYLPQKDGCPFQGKVESEPENKLQ